MIFTSIFVINYPTSQTWTDYERIMRIFNRTVQNACSTAVGHYADSQEASQTFEKKKKKPAVLRRACPQYGGGGSFTITISTIRHTEYSFIIFLLLYILFCFVKRQPGSMLIWKWAGYVVIRFTYGKKKNLSHRRRNNINPLKMSLLSMPFVSSSEHLCPHSTWWCSIVANWHHLKTESSCAQTSIV